MNFTAPPFCFFMPNIYTKKESYVNEFGLPFHGRIGRLVILSYQIDEDLIENINKFVDRKLCPDYDYFESYKDILEFDIIYSLIHVKIDNLIIDLSNPEFNILKQIEFIDRTNRFKRIRLKSLKFLQNLINLRSVEYLKTTISIMYPFPDYLELFPNLKNFEINYAGFERIPGNGFSCLKQLEVLSIKPSGFISNNAFRGLDSLKKLYVIGVFNVKLENDTFKELNNLEELIIDTYNVTSVEPNTFEYLKKLTTLFIDSNKIEKIDLNGLNSLKHFYFKGGKNKLVFDSNFFKNRLNVTVIDLEDSIYCQLPADIFIELKCLKYLSICDRRIISNDDKIMTNFDFLKPLNKLEYLRLALSEDLYSNFNQIKLPCVKFLSIKCRIFKVLENNFENLVTLEIKMLEKLEPGCFDKLKGIKNLLLIFHNEKRVDYIDSKYFATLDNLDYLKARSWSGRPIGLDKFDSFLQMFDKGKKLNKDIRDSYAEVSNENVEIDIYSGLTNETKEAINFSRNAISR
ncbi:unnamed protein product [Brachionus calyciflorus]|uniref:Uncharacterized protein n=1 Tax=Brachionus calyciflorus TaxID=104777 RepID=A0A814I859_9BILA|nr:unnamed protein product [Brachionus calyciflorus]